VWFAEIGTWAAELAQQGISTVVALSVPTREYAALLVAFGAVDQASRRGTVPAQSELSFEGASDVAAGECVRVVPVSGPEAGKRAYTGLFRGAVVNHHGRVYELSGRRGLDGGPGLLSWFPADLYRLQVLRWPDMQDEYADRNRFSEVFEVPAGARALLAGGLPDFYGHCSLDCVLVGVASTVMAEAQEVVAAPSRQALSLQELMRLRSVHSPGTHYRSVIVSSRGDPEEYRDLVRSSKPAVAVLDGAAAVRRWLTVGLAGVTVAVVERTSPSAAAAADALYGSRARSKADLSVPARLAKGIPAGVELLAWQKRGPVR
jgi:hypothetical protein